MILFRLKNKTILWLFGLMIVIPFWYACTGIVKDTEKNKQTKLETLGHYLFFDKRISANNTKSCSSCHNPEFAFTDGYRKSITAFGENVNRNAPSLINVTYHRYFNWADSSITSLQAQHIIPLYSKHPVELGLDSDSSKVFSLISKSGPYQSLLKKLKYPRINNQLILDALAAYLSTLRSYQSAYDNYRHGQTDAISHDQLKGSLLFFSDEFKCNDCHTYPPFTNNWKAIPAKNNYVISEVQGLDSGLYHLTKNKNDIYRFVVPTLRNCGLTAPYFHDGSAANLYDVLKRHQPFKKLTKDEEKYMVAFLYSLTDSTIFANTLFKNPF